jgi:quinol---cytochrome c reductase iron-sulfur subunit, bacillus type
MPNRKTTESEQIPGAFEGETVTRRRFVTGTANIAGAVATAAIVLPAIGFAVGPALKRQPTMWQPVGRPDEFPDNTYVPRVINLTSDDIGDIGKTTVFVRRRNPRIDTEPADRWNQYIAVTSRCAHVGCPVNYVPAAESFVCPCHGGVYDFRGIRVGGPPPRPLDRFFTRIRAGQLEIGPRYSVNSELKRFAPRDPGEPLDGIGPILYPPRPTTPKFP